MIDYAALSALAAIERTGAFDRAAALLGVTQSAISQRIRGLEERMGTTLIVRGQPARATEAGARLIAHADEVRLMEHALIADMGLREDTAWPQVRIAVNADSLATWVLPALAQVSGLLYDIEIDDQDYSADWLRRGAVSAAVTAHSDPVQGCNSIPLGSLRYVATAAPGFAQRWFADGINAETLRRCPVIVYDNRDRLQHDWARRMTGQTVELPQHRLASSHGFHEAGLLGLGWSLNPLRMVSDDLAAGRLVQLDDQPFDTPLYWQIRRVSSKPLNALTKALRRAAKTGLEQT